MTQPRSLIDIGKALLAALGIPQGKSDTELRIQFKSRREARQCLSVLAIRRRRLVLLKREVLMGEQAARLAFREYNSTGNSEKLVALIPLINPNVAPPCFPPVPPRNAAFDRFRLNALAPYEAMRRKIEEKIFEVDKLRLRVRELAIAEFQLWNLDAKGGDEQEAELDSDLGDEDESR